MILGYRCLLDLDEENEDFVHVHQELVHQNSSNSRTKAMFLVNDVVQFYLALFHINEVFCNTSCVSVRWANDNLRGPHGGVSMLTLIDSIDCNFDHNDCNFQALLQLVKHLENIICFLASPVVFDFDLLGVGHCYAWQIRVLVSDNKSNNVCI